MWCPSASQQAPGLKQWVSVQKPLVPKAKDLTSDKKHEATFKAALQEGYLRVLDKELILDFQARTEGADACSELKYVQRIDVSGSYVHKLDEVSILSCVRLRICNLSSCYVQEIGAFYGSINLLKLDLSNNQVRPLGPVRFISACSGSACIGVAAQCGFFGCFIEHPEQYLFHFTLHTGGSTSPFCINPPPHVAVGTCQMSNPLPKILATPHAV